MTLEQFKKNKQPKKVSVLDKYQDEILELYRDNFSQQSIVDFLKTKGIKTSRQNVGKFINKLTTKNDNNITTKKQDKVPDTEKKSKQLFNVDLDKKVGKNTELKKPDWL